MPKRADLVQIQGNAILILRIFAPPCIRTASDLGQETATIVCPKSLTPLFVPSHSGRALLVGESETA